MWGRAYVESDDAFVSCVIALCFAMYNMDFIDVIVSCTFPLINVIFSIC